MPRVILVLIIHTNLDFIENFSKNYNTVNRRHDILCESAFLFTYQLNIYQSIYKIKDQFRESSKQLILHLFAHDLLNFKVCIILISKNINTNSKIISL